MCYTNEKSGVVTCPVCGHTTEISWDTVGGKETVLMHTPCSHLLNSSWEGQPGHARFFVYSYANTEKEIALLAQEIKDFALTYPTESNPSALFAEILSRHECVDDHDLFFSIPPTLNDFELEKLATWLVRAIKTCTTSKDWQSLYDAIVYLKTP